MQIRRQRLKDDICDDMIIGETMENLIKQVIYYNYRALSCDTDLSTVKKQQGIAIRTISGGYG